MRFIFLFFLILGAGCTINQDRRIRELLTVQTGAYHRTRDVQIVEDALATAPAGQFSLTILPDNPLSSVKGTFPVFVLKGDSLPLQERFIFAAIDRVSGVIDPRCEFEVLADGNLQIFDKTGISYANEIPFIASEGLKAGHPIDYVVVSKKTYAYAIDEFIPYPIEKVEDLGERAELIVTHPMGTHLTLRATGFSPYESLVLIHTSGLLEERQEVIADQTGSFNMGLNPTILGKLGGLAHLTIERLHAKALTFDYPWGTWIDKQTWKERASFPMLLVVNRDPSDGYTERLATLFS
ncbi:MAG: hypothetical protein HY861_01180 [Chlamydiia bacterium]|nr:hypothetical protein [Chlamydiia bacterium]